MAADFLVVGFGNPGAEYEGTRHNVGSQTVMLLASRHGGALKRGRHRALAGNVHIGDRKVTLAFPQTFYNESGVAVMRLAAWDEIDEPERIVIVHDELDLPPGRIKVKVGGGLAGNNGLRSVKSHLHTDEFVRVRIGVGKPPGRMQGVDHVLKRPGKTERAELDVAIEEAADAVELIVTAGVERAMERYNQRD